MGRNAELPGRGSAQLSCIKTPSSLLVGSRFPTLLRCHPWWGGLWRCSCLWATSSPLINPNKAYWFTKSDFGGTFACCQVPAGVCRCFFTPLHEQCHHDEHTQIFLIKDCKLNPRKHWNDSTSCLSLFYLGMHTHKSTNATQFMNTPKDTIIPRDAEKD